MKKRVLRAAAVIFGVLLLCTFFGRTVYYYTLPKVAVERPTKMVFGDREALVTVPATAMVTSYQVFVIRPEQGMLGVRYIAELRAVVPGETDGLRVELVSGLAPNECIAEAWDRAITDGRAVDVVSGEAFLRLR